MQEQARHLGCEKGNCFIGRTAARVKGYCGQVAGRSASLRTMNELEAGLLIAIVVILLMLTVNFQSFRFIASAVLSVVRASNAGSGVDAAW